MAHSVFNDISAGLSLTPYLESFTPTFGQGTPVFPRISSNLYCGTPTFSKSCLWDFYFQNPSENPEAVGRFALDLLRHDVSNVNYQKFPMLFYKIFSKCASNL